MNILGTIKVLLVAVAFESRAVFWVRLRMDVRLVSFAKWKTSR